MKDITTTQLYDQIKEIMQHARKKVYTTANFAMVEAYWYIGKSIVEQQNGENRAEYGKYFLEELAKQMTRDFGKGFTVTNLQYIRKFYIAFPIQHALRVELSWTHYRLLLKVKSEQARTYYLNECANSNWSSRQLERQINSYTYERLLSTKSKSLNNDNEINKPEDIIKDPYVLEFLGLQQSASFFESDLEQALIDHLQNFLLELGNGFSFVARQKRLSFDGEHYYVDLVFYNYILKCFVLIDLKTGKLKHQDLGQMQMYVNYYTRELMNEGDNLPIGIVLCADKSESVVRYTLPEGNNQIFTSKYSLYLPTEEQLQYELHKEYQVLEANLA